MTSDREDAERQFAKVTRKAKAEQTESKSRSITEAEKTEHDLKTAKLKKQREQRDVELKKGKR
jgi:hypothetical protein